MPVSGIWSVTRDVEDVSPDRRIPADRYRHLAADGRDRAPLSQGGAARVDRPAPRLARNRFAVQRHDDRPAADPDTQLARLCRTDVLVAPGRLARPRAQAALRLG